MTNSLSFNPPVIAHRGASAYAPENTLIAFTKAAELGIKWVEFDVMQAATGEPVIFHDETLDRTTNGTGDLDQFPYSYLRTLDAGAWFNPSFSGERIPTLLQTLAFLETANLSANVELKALPGKEAALVERVFFEMKDYLKKYPSRILFSSFSPIALTLLRQYSSDCMMGFLMHDWLPDWQAQCDAINAVSVNVNEEIMTKERAAAILATNRKLVCYTVNTPERAKELYAMGVDAVFSDHPDKMLGLKIA